MSINSDNDNKIQFQNEEEMRKKLPYLPWSCKLKDNTNVVIDLMKENEIEIG